MPKRSTAPASKPAPRSVADLSRVEYLRQSMLELEAWAQEAAARGSWQAVGKLKADAIRTRGELDQAIEEEAAPTDAMSDEELVLLIQRAIASVPEAHLEVIEDALQFRRGARPSAEPVQ